MPEVFIAYKNPGDSDKFEEVEKDDIVIFINRELILDQEVKIRVPKYASDLAGKEFEVVGATPPKM